MKITVAKYSGFCFGVKAAVEIAEKHSAEGAYCLGEIIHNESVVSSLKRKGLKFVDSPDKADGGKIIIRSHGVGRNVYKEISDMGLTVIDATCPFVKKIHSLVDKYSSDGYKIVIIGKRGHPEVKGIEGWCRGGATVTENENEVLRLLEKHDKEEKLCFVAQTTYSQKKYDEIVKKIANSGLKTVEIFDTICYTTTERQFEALQLASENDKVLVVGSKSSSNTTKLYETCKSVQSEIYHIEKVADLKNIKFNPYDSVAVVAGASTPEELILEVKGYMSDNFEGVSKEFEDLINESFVQYKDGMRIKGTVIHANESGIKVNIGGKKDGFIKKEEVNVDGRYDPSQYPEGTAIEAIITNKSDADSGCVLLSKKKVDKIKEGDKVVETVRGGEVFELDGTRSIKGGLLGHLGTYSVFIPASQIRERGGFIKDLKAFEGQKLRLTAIEIDDEKHEIVASQRKVLEEERKEKEDVFWANVRPNVVVSGVVKRATNFGAFVSVDGIDCLAHIVDLSWSHIKSVEDVLKIGETYDFLVLSADREKNRVSLGYKQLQPHPFVKAMENHPVGSVTKGKVVSVLPFGAFVEIEPGIEGLVHVSEAAHNFVKNINEVVKVGDEVEVKVLAVDEPNKKITLSIKACQQAPEQPVSEKPAKTEEQGDSAAKPDRKPAKKVRQEKSAEDRSEWSEEISNNPFADLLKDLDVK
ncbi:MAG: bifunctional 4-hydroxy-3-methylbut-2-enyl diphosphate reductase/30S ribosomal protein S1 [Clostridia bacterium]|nr:bifunctional 4-hydroxy-3-methylbut-2-enyl diphosphate reductase/30S ribosomal protein S1 [Clostridia bacterium]